MATKERTIEDVLVQIIASGPTNRWGNTHMLFIKAISGAKNRIYIQTPYFLPSEGLLTALQCAALSGVDVRVMLPHKSDSAVLTHASTSYVEECLLAGMKIYFYNAGMLHSKLIIIDNEIVSIGSTNFDFRSFDYNFEANMFFFSKDFNTKILEIFKEDLKKSSRVVPSQWRKRPIKDKIAESIIRLLSPVL